MNLRKYSMEYVFSTSSVPNIFIDLVKDFFHKTILTAKNIPIGLMATKDDWPVFAKYLTLLCEELRGLMTNEDKLIKVNFKQFFHAH